MRNVDVAIIGASLAGAACVRTLAQAGVDAIAIERDRFPREKVCGGFLSPGAVEILDELGVLNTLRTAGAVEVRSARLRSDGMEIDIPFRRAGLGVSRRTLDELLANHSGVKHGNVLSVDRQRDGKFRIRLSDGSEFSAKILVDAAGKLSRFTEMQTSPQFGVQFYEAESRGDFMDFWFFRDGYGGTVGVEGNRSNSCFLIRRDALQRYVGKPNCLVTGPVAYRSLRSEFIPIGDAAGMIDPFCGEGMHHALDTGRIAAKAVIRGLERHWSYGEIRRAYEAERSRRWYRKRAMARVARFALQNSVLHGAGLKLNLEWIV
ncbi:MAG TPA: NAD(P)/FAD-dependent oxidoreductase, partial [Terriglobia bacterium]|nr:NAD(P)/FAD-dependent oxidoreductase [Terriglobia bacterium]